MCRFRRLRSTAALAACLVLTLIAGAATRAHAQFPTPTPPPIQPNPTLPPITFDNPLTAAIFNLGWESRGPFETSGAIRHVIVDPANDHKLYAASENGGIWVLDDDQATTGWRPLSDKLENLQMRGVARSPSLANFILAANALGFIYQTTDGGLSWTKTSTTSFQYVRRLLLSETLSPVATSKGGQTFLSPHRDLFVASRIGLYRIRFTSGSPGTPGDPVKLFPVAAGQNTDVLDVVMHPSDPSVMFVGVRNQGVWRTENGGSTWKLVATTTQFGDVKSEMLKLAMNADRVVAKFGRNVFTNDANGDSGQWHAAANVGFGEQDGGSDIGYRGNYSGKSGEWATGLAIHPTNKDIIIAGQANLMMTTNGGTSWTQITGLHEDVQSLAFSDNGDRLYISTDGGVFRRTMSGGAMNSLNKNLTTLQFFRLGFSGNVAVGNVDHQGIRGTQNIDANPPVWEFATTGASGYGNDALENDHLYADPKRANRFLVAFGQRDVLRLRYPKTGSTEDLLQINETAPAAPPRPFFMRTNDNAKFNQLNYPVGIFAFDPRQGSKIVLCAASQVQNSTFGIRISRDGDAEPHGGPRTDCLDDNSSTFCFTTPVTGFATWTLSHSNGTTPIVSLAFAAQEPGKAYALDETGHVLVKDNVDNDDAWHAVGSFSVGTGDFARQIVADPTTTQKLYAMTHKKVLVSTNGGASWSPIYTSSVKINALLPHPTKANYLFVALDGDVIGTPNTGANWYTTGNLLPNCPIMQLQTQNGWLYAATFGRGVWRARLPV